MKREYRVVRSCSRGAAKAFQNRCQATGQMPLPPVALISEARVVVDAIIDQDPWALADILGRGANAAASQKENWLKMNLTRC